MNQVKINKLANLIQIFDQMAKDLKFGRLSNIEKDVLLTLCKIYTKEKTPEIDIKKVDFLDYEGKKIAKSTLYKSLKSLCNKNLITHQGSERSSKYRLN